MSKKISQLTDGTSFQAGDEAVVNRSGTNYKVDPTQFGSSIDVTGTITADELTVDGHEINFGDNSATIPNFNYEANPATSGATLGQLAYKWNGTKIVTIEGLSGDDTTNKDNGVFRLRVAESGNLNSGGLFVLDHDGNAGFGTSSPSQALDVVGNIEVSGGIYLGGTAAANLLDDYEEGTFTPTITGSTTAGTGTYSVQSGRYIKIGNKVTVVGYIAWSAHTGAGNMRISNLPFTSLNVADVYSPASFSFLRFLTLPASSVMTGDLPPNSTDIVLRTYTLGTANPTDLVLDTSAQMMFSITYPAA